MSTALRTQYLYVELSVRVKQSNAAVCDDVLLDEVMKRLAATPLFSFLTPVEAILARRASSAVPLFRVPHTAKDTEWNTAVLSTCRDTLRKGLPCRALSKAERKGGGKSSSEDDDNETAVSALANEYESVHMMADRNRREKKAQAMHVRAIALEMLCHTVRKPTLLLKKEDTHAPLSLSITTQTTTGLSQDQLAATIDSFLSTQQLYAIGEGVTHLIGARMRSLPYPVFVADGETQRLLRWNKTTLDCLVRTRPVMNPLLLTPGLFALLCWLCVTFDTIAPITFSETRPFVFVWVGESRIGKTTAVKALVEQGIEYHCGSIYWDSYMGDPLQVLDDIAIGDETLVRNLKTLLNSNNEGSVRRAYGTTKIRKCATVILVNDDTFQTLRTKVLEAGSNEWLKKNSVLYPPENSWDEGADIVVDQTRAYVHDTRHRDSYGKGIALLSADELREYGIPLLSQQRCSEQCSSQQECSQQECSQQQQQQESRQECVQEGLQVDPTAAPASPGGNASAAEEQYQNLKQLHLQTERERERGTKRKQPKKVFQTTIAKTVERFFCEHKASVCMSVGEMSAERFYRAVALEWVSLMHCLYPTFRYEISSPQGEIPECLKTVPSTCEDDAMGERCREQQEEEPVLVGTDCPAHCSTPTGSLDASQKGCSQQTPALEQSAEQKGVERSVHEKEASVVLTHATCKGDDSKDEEDDDKEEELLFSHKRQKDSSAQAKEAKHRKERRKEKRRLGTNSLLMQDGSDSSKSAQDQEFSQDSLFQDSSSEDPSEGDSSEGDLSERGSERALSEQDFSSDQEGASLHPTKRVQDERVTENSRGDYARAYLKHRDVWEAEAPRRRKDFLLDCSSEDSPDDSPEESPDDSSEDCYASSQEDYGDESE